MSHIPIWPGSSSFFPGDTPFGFYDNDQSFQTDSERVATWCASRLGYPLVDIELQAINFFAAFEEATNEYGTQLYNFQIINTAIKCDRLQLYERINNRVDEMMNKGLLNEVKDLIDYKNLRAMNTVGYKELFLYLDNKISLKNAIIEIKKNSRRFAKRQMTWLRKKDDIK